MLVIFLDPVSIDLADPGNQRFAYDLKSSLVLNQVLKTFAEVGGNVEVLVVADAVGKRWLERLRPQARASSCRGSHRPWTRSA